MPEARYVVRELPGEEWAKLLACPPFSEMGQVTLRAGSDRVVVIEERATGRVLGYWFGWWAFHVEPLWIDQPVRGNGSVIRRLWAAVLRMLSSAGVDTAFAIIHPSNAAADYAMRLGFRPTPGLSYIWQAPLTEEQQRILEELRKAAPRKAAQGGTVEVLEEGGAA